TGTGQAILFDVRNGYPYGTASRRVDLSSLSPSFGSYYRRENLETAALEATFEALVPDVEALFAEVAAEAARR
ncbi:MAG: hypothetical protein AAFW69_07065, partial [Pseudomonadota bacterium]